jgi:DNA-binding Xre family transcriptional regulator
MNKTELQVAARISTTSMSKLSKGENIQTDVLVKICKALDCNITDIMDLLPDDKSNDDNKKEQK